MSHYKPNISLLPVYNDGSFLLYEIFNANEIYPKEYLKIASDDEYFYQELSLSDSIIFENEKRTKKINQKIRIPQDKDITSKNVLKINNEYYKVFNIYHFTNKDDILESDITLEEYLHPIVKE